MVFQRLERDELKNKLKNFLREAPSTFLDFIFWCLAKAVPTTYCWVSNEYSQDKQLMNKRLLSLEASPVILMIYQVQDLLNEIILMTREFKGNFQGLLLFRTTFLQKTLKRQTPLKARRHLYHFFLFLLPYLFQAFILNFH